MNDSTDGAEVQNSIDQTELTLTLQRHAAETFTHKPLDHTKQTIRLIRILPDRSSSGFIQCDIYHATIEAEYVCLSYMWGPPEPSQTILMNGKYHQIGPNLFDFLNVAREKYRSERLWIDALCIDQANTAERNHQVQQMGQIYSEAQKVIIWLGKEDGLDPISRSKYAGRPTWDMVFKFSIPRYWESVFCNAYWTRAWVAQEILLARRRIILLNTTQIPWEKLVHFAGRNLRGRRNEYEQLFGAIRHVAAGKKSLSLIELLFRFRQQECKVPRDRVFSLLSLCSEGKQLRAVYDLPERDLLFQILDCYKKYLCLCSAVLVAHKIGLKSDLVLESGVEYFLEMDIEAKRYGKCYRQVCDGWSDAAGIENCRSGTCACHVLGPGIRCKDARDGAQRSRPYKPDIEYGMEPAQSGGTCSVRISFRALANMLPPDDLCRRGYTWEPPSRLVCDQVIL